MLREIDYFIYYLNISNLYTISADFDTKRNFKNVFGETYSFLRMLTLSMLLFFCNNKYIVNAFAIVLLFSTVVIYTTLEMLAVDIQGVPKSVSKH